MNETVKQILVDALQAIPVSTWDNLSIPIPLPIVGTKHIPLTQFTGGQNPIEFLLSKVGDTSLPDEAVKILVDLSKKIVDAVENGKA